MFIYSNIVPKLLKFGDALNGLLPQCNHIYRNIINDNWLHLDIIIKLNVLILNRCFKYKYYIFIYSKSNIRMIFYLNNDLSTKCYLLFMYIVIDIIICNILSRNYIYAIKANPNFLSHL